MTNYSCDHHEHFLTLGLLVDVVIRSVVEDVTVENVVTVVVVVVVVVVWT